MYKPTGMLVSADPSQAGSDPSQAVALIRSYMNVRFSLYDCVVTGQKAFEPSHEIMALFVLRKPILQTRMCSHPVWLDV